MAQVFPASLQQLLNRENFTQTFGETTLRSSMDVGPDKVRSRYTKGIDTFTCSIDMLIADYTTLETFYKTTLANGSLTFEYDHPLTGVTTEFRFTAPPSMRPKGGIWVTVTMNWEEML